VFASKDTTLLDIPAEFAHLPFPMMPLIEFADPHARPTKFGTHSFVPADACLHTTLLEEFAPNAMPILKSTTKNSNAVTALTDIKKFQVKDAMEFAPPSATSTKIGFQEDVSASLDSF
jgi:hypothetical protein